MTPPGATGTEATGSIVCLRSANSRLCGYWTSERLPSRQVGAHFVRGAAKAVADGEEGPIPDEIVGPFALGASLAQGEFSAALHAKKVDYDLVLTKEQRSVYLETFHKGLNKLHVKSAKASGQVKKRREGMICEKLVRVMKRETCINKRERERGRRMICEKVVRVTLKHSGSSLALFVRFVFSKKVP